MADTEQGRGWLPAEALEAERDAASVAAADALLARPPRERVLELMCLAAAGKATDRALRPADLARVLASFDGDGMPGPQTLLRLFPGTVLPDG